MVLTGSLFRESCKDAIFWLTAIGVIPRDGVYGLNVCSADGTLWAGGRTSSVLVAAEWILFGACKRCPQPATSPGVRICLQEE